jgi:hypothetical protein
VAGGLPADAEHIYLEISEELGDTRAQKRANGIHIRQNLPDNHGDQEAA